jgi:sterol desaturase/sphingolipid hydroxylase (fatty acid hydroxylase superfamily)
MTWLGRPTPLSQAFRLEGLAANLGFALALAMGRDLGRILVHYPMHKIPALWQIHKYHHNAEVLTPFTAFRLHPIESALSSLTGGLCHGVALYLFIWIFGAEKVSPVTFLGMGAVELWTGSMGMFEHSNKWLSLGRFGYIFANPSNHLVHHSCEERHWDKNFANHFAIFDLLLGTLYIPKREEHFRIGVHLPNGKPLVSRSLFRDFYYRPVAEFLRAVSKRPALDVKDDAHPKNSVELNCWCGPNCPVLANPTSREAQPSPAWTKLSDLLPQRRSEPSLPQQAPVADTSDRPSL